ncbi:Sua5/YciO/YrdC/YwlC family protein [Blochmannia endosymbiont of Camponotus (Colobopsis) obliquus]|uniref:Sua5/YciO/YrdC/YwlC family protein n=1 Tax=Blochmannia endosymbiont of Camponotus (Colobopsis) obliquus TaxID=1505597 RepID=UPI00061A7AF4|nr:Sua5/YciO/YrdC/YwlC family protein [Blochmannia endosymbiont of Camponotus (Colobopsis) obliquus]AKC60390.1 tRNA threonylcarbamoyladenosine biosynthesis protein RimN [Blochmannia endosymbiont of Camponotus (Colobopsis) obliquus]
MLLNAMIGKFNIDNQNVLLEALHDGQVIAYPTETIFSLGCDPDNILAVERLLSIKRRSWKKGFILVGANYKQLFQYIDDSLINDQQCLRVFRDSFFPITWVFPVKSTTPSWLIGTFSSLAIRYSFFTPLQKLCLLFGKALISTSANLSGYPPARTISDIYKQFGYSIPVMKTDLINKNYNPSKIRDARTGIWLRY